MNYHEFKDIVMGKIKKSGSSFIIEKRKYEMMGDILYILEQRSYPLFKVQVERGHFLVRIKSVRLESLSAVEPQAEWDADRYITICKYNYISSLISTAKEQLNSLKDRRIALMAEEARYQEELNNIVKELGKYAN